MIKWINPDWKIMDNEDSKLLENDIENNIEEHKLDYYQCLNFLNKSGNIEQQERFSKIMMKLAFWQDKYIKKWPNHKWDFYGFIDPRTKCRRQLECDKWYYQWYEPSLYTFKQRVRALFWTSLKPRAYLNHLGSMFAASSCPICEVVIYHQNNSSTEICYNCNTEFCFSCFDTIINGRHVNRKFWYWKTIINLLMFLYLITMTINLQFAIKYKTYGNALINILKTVTYVIFANVIFLSVLLDIIFVKKFQKYKQVQTWKGKILCFVYFIISTLWPFVWVVGLLLGYLFSDYMKKLEQYLMIQWGGILGGCLVIATVVSLLLIFLFFSILNAD